MKIFGLKPYHRRMLRKSISETHIDGNIQILFTDKISLKRLDCLWYGGNVAEIKYKGYTFHIEATGDVYAVLYTAHSDKQLCYVKDKNNGGYFSSEMLSYFRSDKVLYNLLGNDPKRYRLELEHNNWWECFVTDPAGNFHDLMWNLDEDNLFKAVNDVLGGLDETIKSLEEAA